MSATSSSVPTATVPPLDRAFVPPIRVHRRMQAAVAASRQPEPLILALEMPDGTVSRWETALPDDAAGLRTEVLRYAERCAKFLLWARGGCRLHVGGPAWIGEHIRAEYRAGGRRAFDAGIMERVYERPFEVLVAAPEAIPPERPSEAAVGGHLDGCRIGFDLGASDYKLAAVRDGEVVFSTEIPWNPREQADPSYHERMIEDGLRQAAAHLPRVDAIGGSSAGIYISNRPRVASLFRAVAPADFDARVLPLFERIGARWGVPLVVLNDGDVTALAGAMSLRCAGVLGIAMGSSEAAGFVNRDGRLTHWLSELAFAPVDLADGAPTDEWSGDAGVGANYFSQQAVGRLAPVAGLDLPPGMALPERLREAQARAAAGDAGARRIFETIGVYLGHAIPWYRLFYDFTHLLVLGRVTSGDGGAILLRAALETLRSNYPETALGVEVHLPDEKSRRVGQAVAAASLPELRK